MLAVGVGLVAHLDPFQQTSERVLGDDRLAGGGVHQGVLAVVEARPAADLDEILARCAGAGPCTLVVLDGVQDPHNLGAVVRNAALTGAAAVLVPKDRAAGVTPVVV